MSVVAVLRDVLDDHVDVDVGLGERPEDRRGDARLVLHAAERDLGLVLGIGDAGDELLFHDLVLVADERAGACGVWAPGRRRRSARRSARRAPWRARPSAPAAPWRRATPFRASPRRRPCRAGGPWRRCAGRSCRRRRRRCRCRSARPDRRGDRDGARVRAAAPERGDAARCPAQPLEAGDHRDLAPLGEAARGSRRRRCR